MKNPTYPAERFLDSWEKFRSVDELYRHLDGHCHPLLEHQPMVCSCTINREEPQTGIDFYSKPTSECQRSGEDELCFRQKNLS